MAGLSASSWAGERTSAVVAPAQATWTMPAAAMAWGSGVLRCQLPALRKHAPESVS